MPIKGKETASPASDTATAVDLGLDFALTETPAPPPDQAATLAPPVLVIPTLPPEDEALFRCESAPNLVQYLPSGAKIEFKGQFFRTRDTALTAEMRALIDSNQALYYEDDPEPIFPCPYCVDVPITFQKYADLRAHLRQEHPGLTARPA